LREFAGLLYAKKWFILASVLLLALFGMLSMTVLTYTYFAF
jgi:LPS O-antigen subunit length determinant protein (WzzB/FepE family)